MNFIKKLQNKPEYTRKTILWIIMAVAGLILLIFWIIIISQTIKGLEKQEIMEELNISALKEELEGLPAEIKENEFSTPDADFNKSPTF